MKFNMPIRNADDNLQGRARPPDAPSGGGARTRRHAKGLRRVRRPRPAGTTTAGFTLAEVLAALLFMAIVIPVAIAALQVASSSGEVAARKATAARVADRVLNETVVTAGSSALPQKGTAIENGQSFRWTLQRENWPVILTSTSAMQVLTTVVAFSAQGRDYDVRLSTLVNAP
jgi:type II secretory pathway pseudopilin PulG